MGYAIGSLLALGVSVFARSAGFDRDRAFYPTVLIVVAAYYVLFAVMGGDTNVLVIETVVMAAFALMAVAGFKYDLRIAAAGLVLHGVLDIFHAGIVNNPGVPVWWPPFCMAYDVVAGGILASLLLRKQTGSPA